MKDLTGKTIKEGQICDIVVNGVLHGTIVRVQDAPLMASANKMIPAQAIVQVVIPVTADGAGVLDLYVIQDGAPVPKPTLVQ